MFSPSSILRRVAAVAVCGACPTLSAGPYSAGLNDPGNAFDAPVPGFLGPHGIGKARLFGGIDPETNEPIYQNPLNYVNPLFFAWAETVEEYTTSESVVSQYGDFSDPSFALGPVTGDNFDVASLGDLSTEAMENEVPPGTITITLAKPIRDLTGADFVVFENGHIAQSNLGGAGVGGIFAEFAYVEVSGDGETFVRFPSASLNGPLPALPAPLGTAYASLDPTNVRNLAGKHVNANGDSWGTPFDLANVGLAQITHIRIVDIPGNGSFSDSLGNPIYDAWKTAGSGGFDLEAVAGISAVTDYADWPPLAMVAENLRGKDDDPDGDGVPNLLEYAFARLPWMADAAEHLPALRLVSEAGTVYPNLEFLRDERLADLTYEVQVSNSLGANDWTTIARSTAGGPVLAVNGHNPVISEVSASPITGIGVIRKLTVRDALPVSGGGNRFFRVKVISEPASIPSE